MLVDNVLVHGSSWEPRLSYPPTAVRPLLHNAVKVLSSLSGRGLSPLVSLNVNGDVPESMHLSSALLQVLLNIGSNAVKYGDGKPVDVMAFMFDTDVLQIEVLDQGAGVD